MRRLNGRVVLVAGGAGGIGTATCLRLASEGAKICVGDIDQAGVAEVVKKVTSAGGEIEGATLDLARPASIKAATVMSPLMPEKQSK